MARFVKALGRNRDIPQLETYSGVAVNAGTSSDFEHIITALPDLTAGAPSGGAGNVPSNAMSIRYCLLTFEAAITGAATDNCTFKFRQRRGGTLVATTTATTAVASAGLATITPASMANIFAGQSLDISGGTGTAETVIVQKTTSTTFDAVFANTHSGTYNIVQTPLASITFDNGVNAAAWTPLQFTAKRNIVQRGDVITVQRVSSTSTGLASPAYEAAIDWASAGLS
jgi:hypothetical protein